jgi:hypothetical protein
MLPRIKRNLPTVTVSRTDLALDPFPTEFQDIIFNKLYSEMITGKANFAYTRVSRSRIQSGFKKLRPDSTYEIIEYPPVRSADVDAIKREIRSGYRYEIYVYYDTEENKFICSDDIAILKAYTDLGIEGIPVLVMDPQKGGLEHSALLFKCMPTLTAQSIQEEYFEDVSVSEAFASKIPSLLGNNLEDIKTNSIHMLEKLEVAVSEVLLELQGFHLATRTEIHWHHTLASSLHRTLRALSAMKNLVKHRLYDQALILLRSLYELSTYVYLDWLSPHRMGVMIQWSSQLKSREFNEILVKIKAERLSKGWSESAAETSRKSDVRLFTLAHRVSERAKLSPLGTFHDEFYAIFSRYAHQDFNMMAEFAHALKHHDIAKPLSYENAEADIKDLIRFADLSTALICSCVKTDIGVGKMQA